MNLLSYFKNFNLYENIDYAKSFLKRNNIPEDDYSFILIKKLLNKNPGYIGWFTKMFYSNDVLFSDLSNLYNTIVNDNEVIQNLPRPLIEYDNWENLMDDIILSNKKIKAKRIYNKFPHYQKSLININSKYYIDLLYDLYNLRDNDIFIKKISRYKDRKELLDSLDLFIKGERNDDYDKIKKIILESKANIIYDSSKYDIIVCEVNYNQLRMLASDTSWCILSESTFKNYNFLNNQYIIFLTDKKDRFSKIGVTYGFKFITAHLKDDLFIGSQSISNILEERGTSIDILKVKDYSFFFQRGDFSGKSVDYIISKGVSKDIILKYKKVYNRLDLKNFTKEEIDEYKLIDKLAIEQRDVIYMSFNDIIKNRERIIDTISIKYLSFTREEILCLNDLNIFNDESIKILNFVEENRFNILDKLNSIIEYLFFALGYCDINSSNTEISTILNKIKFFYKYDRLEHIAKRFNEFGYKLDSPVVCLDIFNKTDKPSFGNIYNHMIDSIKYMPGIYSIICQYINNEYNFTDLMNISEKNKEILKKYYDDYDNLMKKVKIHKAFYELRCVLPDPSYANYGLGRRESIDYMRSKNRDYDIITPEDVYSDFYDIIKDRPISNELTRIYIIFTLCKVDKYDEIGKLNIKWTDSLVGKIIRIALDHYSYSGREYIHKSFNLDEDERLKFFTYLLAHIKDRIVCSISNRIVDDINLFRHEVFSLVYYIYGWGFNNYYKLVIDSKNIYKESWNKNFYKEKKVRIMYFSHIFDYLIRKDKDEELLDLIDRVMNIKMLDNELSISRDFLYYRLSYRKEKICEHVFRKYFSIMDMRKYK